MLSIAIGAVYAGWGAVLFGDVLGLASWAARLLRRSRFSWSGRQPSPPMTERQSLRLVRFIAASFIAFGTILLLIAIRTLIGLIGFPER
ncbi:hypothetical protein ACQP00_29650 [Dactylosporangium sp. CS-047395]|uniref:hypothetical protein n=1 Tax=Dactylosporangium sp. CS-047395 TaxID=3239936 RepID=UPI003D93A80D